MTGSDTLGLVLMQMGYANTPLEKQAISFGWLRGAGKAIPAVEKGLASAAPAFERGVAGAAHDIPGAFSSKVTGFGGGGAAGEFHLPGTASYKPTGIGGAVEGAESSLAKSPPRWRPSQQGVPISTSVPGLIPGMKQLGGWLDRGANSGWMGRIATAIPRALMPGKGLYGMAGFNYGVSKAMDARNEGQRMEEATNFAAAQAIRQMRGLSPLERFGAMFMGDDTVAGYLRKKNPGVARQFQYQGDPEYTRAYPQELARRIKIPFAPMTNPTQ